MARIATVRVKDIKVTLCNLHPYNWYKLCMQTVAIIIDINATLNPTQQHVGYSAGDVNVLYTSD